MAGSDTTMAGSDSFHRNLDGAGWKWLLPILCGFKPQKPFGVWLGHCLSKPKSLPHRGKRQTHKPNENQGKPSYNLADDYPGYSLSIRLVTST